MTKSRSSSSTAAAVVIWTLFVILVGIGLWLGVLLPLLFSVTSQLAWALIAFAAAATILIVYIIRRSRAAE